MWSKDYYNNDKKRNKIIIIKKLKCIVNYQVLRSLIIFIVTLIWEWRIKEGGDFRKTQNWTWKLFIYIYLSKSTLLLNFKMNFKQEEGGFLQNNESKLSSQFMINVFKSYLQIFERVKSPPKSILKTLNVIFD